MLLLRAGQGLRRAGGPGQLAGRTWPCLRMHRVCHQQRLLCARGVPSEDLCLVSLPSFPFNTVSTRLGLGIQRLCTAVLCARHVCARYVHLHVHPHPCAHPTSSSSNAPPSPLLLFTHRSSSLRPRTDSCQCWRSTVGAGVLVDRTWATRFACAHMLAFAPTLPARPHGADHPHHPQSSHSRLGCGAATVSATLGVCAGQYLAQTMVIEEYLVRVGLLAWALLESGTGTGEGQGWSRWSLPLPYTSC